MKSLHYLFAALLLLVSLNASAAMEINTPGVRAVKAQMQMRHAQLMPYYTSGAVGLDMGGGIVLRDIESVPLAARQKLQRLVVAENLDRDRLYAEVANANAHPEWQSAMRSAFAPRWISNAQHGWWIMSDHGWIQK